MSQGIGRLIRLSFTDEKGICESEYFRVKGNRYDYMKIEYIGKFFKKLLPYSLFKIIRDFYRIILKRNRNYISLEKRLSELQFFRDSVEKIPPSESEKVSDWSSYYETFPSFYPTQEWNVKQNSIYGILKRLKYTTLLDVGCNRGWYAQLAAQQGAKVVAFDIDESCISSLYRDTKKNNLSILPLCIDFTNPLSSQFIVGHQLDNISERLKCDVVLALAIVHHLVFKMNLNFDTIVMELAKLTNNTLIVEFINPDDSFVSEWLQERKGFEWYSLENFINTIKKYYYKVDLFPSTPDSRVIIMCEK